MKLLPAVRFLGLLAASVLCSTSLLLGATYYVDATNGNNSNAGTSSAAAWQTLDRVNNGPLNDGGSYAAGDAILFERGEQWSGQLAPHGAGASGSPIVLDAYGSGSLPPPLLKGNGTFYATVTLSNQPYWEIKNLEITNTGATLADRVGIYIVAQDIGQVDHIHLIDLVIHDVNADFDANDANGGVYITVTGSATPTWYDDVLIDGCYIYNCAQRGITGPYTFWDDRSLTTNTNWTPSTNVIIRNCRFEHCRRQGLVWRVSEGVLIEHNIFANCSDGAHGNAMFVFNTDDAIIQNNESYGTHFEAGELAQDAAGIDVDFRTKRTIVQYNYVHDNGEGGITSTGGGFTGSFNDGTIIRYNILQNNRRWGFHFSGQQTNCQVYNNTVYVSSVLPETLELINFTNWAGWPDGTSFKNNIFANYSTGASYTLGSSTNTTFDYNIYYDANDPATNEPTSTQDPHKLTSDPLLVGPGSGSFGWDTVDGYTLKSGSPALSSGTNMSLGAGGKDYFGHAVPTSGAVNRGAYQGSALSRVATPTFSPTGGSFTAAQTVTLSCATSGASIYYTTDGQTPSPTQGTLYTGSFSVSSSALPLQAVAVKSGMAASSVAKAPFVIVAGTTTILEAEDMTVTTSGAGAGTLSDSNFTGGAGKTTSPGIPVGQWMEFATPSVPAGTYRFSLRYKGYTTRATHYVMIDGVQFGDEVDQYAASPSYLTAHLGLLKFATAGTHKIRFVTSGTNELPVHDDGSDPADARDYVMTADHFNFFTPTGGPPPIMEAEDLVRTVSAGDSSGVNTEPLASEFKVVSLTADAVNDYLEFTTRHVVAGTYNLQLRYKGYSTRGKCTVKVDGVALGGTTDQYDATTTYHTVNVGTKTFASDGTHTIRLTVSAAGAGGGFTLAADKFTFAPPSVFSEAESLAVTSSSGDAVSNVADGAASGGHRMVLSANAVNDYMQFTTGSIAAGVYDLKFTFHAASTRGITQLSVDGIDVGGEVDQYANPSSYKTTTIGAVAFGAAGTHTIRLTVKGQNGSSTGFTLSADAFTLVPQ